MKHILVVDDDSPVRRLLSNAFSHSLDYAVLTAVDNGSALASIGNSAPALVTTDLRRTGGTGEEFIESVRINPATRDIPIFIISASVFANGQFDPRVFRFRIDGAFQKPIPLRELVECAGRTLGTPSDPLLALIHAGVESRVLDYKERVDLSTRSGRASLAKDVLAFSNSDGGHIVVGVREASAGVFCAVGITNEQAESLEVSRLNKSLRVFLGHDLCVASVVVTDSAMRYCVISIKASTDELRFAHAEDANGKLFLGRIYVRNDAAESAEVRDGATMRQLVRRLSGKKSEPW